MKTAYAVGTGSSLLDLSEEDRSVLERSVTLCYGDFWKWDRAWQPTMYSFVDAHNVQPEEAAVLRRWPQTQGLCFFPWLERGQVIDGWTWVRRSLYRFLLREGEIVDLSKPVDIPSSEGSIWTLVQYLAWAGYNRIVLVGAEHTPVGYAHDPTKAHTRNLDASRAEGLMLWSALRQQGIELWDASGPTSTLAIPRLSIMEVADGVAA